MLFHKQHKQAFERNSWRRVEKIAVVMICLSSLLWRTPTIASSTSTVTVVTGRSSEAYLEYDSGGWHDLHTPKHWISSTGATVFCVQHKLKSPNRKRYVRIEATKYYSERTLRGLRIILENGYPAAEIPGLTESEAQQATANAVRFWLSEEGDAYQYRFTNRSERPDNVRANEGRDSVLIAADALLELARKQEPSVHQVSTEPACVTLRLADGCWTGSCRVTILNCQSGYRLSSDSLPVVQTVSGYTGNDGDTLSFRLPKDTPAGAYVITVHGVDNRADGELIFYEPMSGDYQRVVTAAFSGGDVAYSALVLLVPSDRAGGDVLD